MIKVVIEDEYEGHSIGVYAMVGVESRGWLEIWRNSVLEDPQAEAEGLKKFIEKVISVSGPVELHDDSEKWDEEDEEDEDEDD
jgi:hypothetical protein